MSYREYNTTFGSRSDRDLFSTLRLGGPEAVKRKIDNMLRGPMSGIQEAVLAIALHPWELIEIPAVLKLDEGEFRLKEFLYKGTGDYAVEQLDKLVGLLKNDGFEMITAGGYWKRHSQR